MISVKIVLTSWIINANKTINSRWLAHSYSISAIVVSLHNNRLMHESASHGFIFSTDKSNISRSCETGSQAGHWALLSSCLFCTPSLSDERHCPGLPDSCSFPSKKVSALANGPLRAKSFFWDWLWDLVTHAVSGGLGARLQARQGAPAMAHTKQWAGVGITDTPGIIEYNNVFVGILYRNILWRNYHMVMVAKRDVVGADMEVHWEMSGWWAVQMDCRAGGGSDCHEPRVHLPTEALGQGMVEEAGGWELQLWDPCAPLFGDA